MFSGSLYTAFAIFVIGSLYKILCWFRYTIAPDIPQDSVVKRLSAALKGIAKVICSEKILILLKVLFLDVILHRRLLKESFQRWLMHMSIFTGFMLLLLFHAFGDQISGKLFYNYYPTKNPFLFLRNFAGALVLMGIFMAIYRRVALKSRRLFTSTLDRQMIAILAVIMTSGILLETVGIISHTSYQEMVEDYADVYEDEELIALESYWVKNFALVSPNISSPVDSQQLELGHMVHQQYCAECHSGSQWAFMSYGVAKRVQPFAGWLEKKDAVNLLWKIHFLACFIGLAWLPFSKLFHMFVSPLSLMANAVMEEGTSDPLNIATRQIMELDACTHCGACTIYCSVGTAYEEIHNVYILPSEKIGAAKRLAAGRKIDPEERECIQSGLYLCTNCHKCTDICPVGINLQQLWFNLRELLLQQGGPELQALSCLSLYRGLSRHKIEKEHYFRVQMLARETVFGKSSPDLQDGKETIKIDPDAKQLNRVLTAQTWTNSFWDCYSCSTCSNSCPVVASYQNPQEALNLLPHQIIQAAKMGLSDIIFKSNMLQYCLWCFACQENCPQNVHVADILLELKIQSIQEAGRMNQKEIEE